MKHIALAGLFALVAPALAQKGESAGPKWSKEARLEVAKAIAAEEQENDLDKADQLYRAVMKDAARSAEAKAFAAYRLAGLLRRLGKDDEAKAVLAQGGKGQVVSLDDVTNGKVNQDRVRELRAQARKLVEKILDRQRGEAVAFRARLTGISREEVDQLFWIGEPAVVETVAVLQERMKRPYGGGVQAVPGLFQFLWIKGGPVASRFLLETVQEGIVADVVAAAAAWTDRWDIESPLVQAILNHERWEVTRTFLAGEGSTGSNGCGWRLETDQLLKICEDGSARIRATVLTHFRMRQLDPLQTKRMHALVRDALQGSDPELGKEAEKLLAGSASQQSVEGLTLLLEKLPNLVRRQVRIDSLQMPGGETPSFVSAEALALLPALDAAAAAIDPVNTPNDSSRTAVFWLNWLMRYLVQTKEERVIESALGWYDRGYDSLESLLFSGSPVATVGLLQRAGSMADKDRRRTLANLPASGVTDEALAPLLALAPKNPDDDIRQWQDVGRLMGYVGSDEAVDWIMAQWRASKVRAPEKATEQTRWVSWALVSAGRKNQSERLRSAMRDVVRGFGGPLTYPSDQGKLMLALMSMGDEGVLELLSAGVAHTVTDTHPYRADRNKKRVYRPFSYLLYGGEPAHPYTEDQVAETVRKIANLEEHVSFLAAGDPKQVSDKLLMVVAEHDRGSVDSRTWVNEVLARIQTRVDEGKDVGPLEPWLLGQLGREERVEQWLYQCPRLLVDRYRKPIASLIDGEHEHWAEAACIRLWRHDRGVDLPAALENKHASVRLWAIERIQADRVPIEEALLVARLGDGDSKIRQLAASMLGARVSKAAVPQLIACLKDPEQDVQDAASKALTRIRFYHEQQAHWDRILKGMDASPASAVEKLLLQAKPGQKKEQRLLAITSLGVLGKAEALPFLIEWTQESDEAVAKAARAAVQRIHLDPRK